MSVYKDPDSAVQLQTEASFDDIFRETTLKSDCTDCGINSAVIAVVSVLIVCVVLIIAGLLLYIFRSKLFGKDRTDGRQRPQITLIGNQYHLNRTLSFSDADRKESIISSIGSIKPEEREGLMEFERRISKFMDSESCLGSDRNINVSKRDGYVIAEPGRMPDLVIGTGHRDFVKYDVDYDEVDSGNEDTPPKSKYSTKNEFKDDTLFELRSRELAVEENNKPYTKPASPTVDQSHNHGASPSGRLFVSNTKAVPNHIYSPSKKITNNYYTLSTSRPYSHAMGDKAMLQDNQLTGAQSEANMLNSGPEFHLTPPSPKPSKSEASLLDKRTAPIPLPPKAKPLLPPKQTINKSREDVEKINKDILRVSAVNLILKQETAEHEDYDLPKGPSDELDDYDDPPIVHSPNASTVNSQLVFTPRTEYEDDFEELPEVTQAHDRSRQEHEDYDLPVHNHSYY